MPSTTNYKRGDVVLVPFPFTDLRSAKQRPALVISPDTLNSVRDDLLLAGITSQIPAARAVDEFLIPQDQLGARGLPKPSIIKLVKLVALHRSLVIKRIGSLPAPTLARHWRESVHCFDFENRFTFDLKLETRNLKLHSWLPLKLTSNTSRIWRGCTSRPTRRKNLARNSTASSATSKN